MRSLKCARALIKLGAFTEFNRAPSSAVFASDRDYDTTNDDNDDGGIKDFESRRMDIVRILQNTYYRSLNEHEDGGNDGFEESIGNGIRSTGKTATLEETTGRVLNLPLWRVGWVETPGRRNCLNVHEGQYTHIRSGQEKYQLKTWKEDLSDETRFDLSLLNTYKGNDYVNDRSAVIGCLMQIVDHRRMDDGRLIILVQAVERFVVDEIIETKPYAVANVQILLDEEELPWSKSANLQVENNVVEGGNLLSDNAKRAIDENFCKY
ncbi:hypothetical protein HJC23_006819, partial [Cyclotella cryptica]